ncbi:hypothetical protein AQUCO_00800221v1 [Aquilegia coerulea]|uniref:Uncharacterized protein n=1 Tax=Aquilegia coerulea TaxID=218851 RepID=A0A2G5EHW8_AQUCA|nr:hypothetical protein AQUCO_00800221v1 [Aquilegia coerulea]
MPLHLEELIKKINESDDNQRINFIIADAFVGNILKVVEKFGINRAAFCTASFSFLALMLHFRKLVDAGDIGENGNPMKDEDNILLPPGMP